MVLQIINPINFSTMFIEHEVLRGIEGSCEEN